MVRESEEGKKLLVRCNVASWTRIQNEKSSGMETKPEQEWMAQDINERQALLAVKWAMQYAEWGCVGVATQTSSDFNDCLSPEIVCPSQLTLSSLRPKKGANFLWLPR